MFDQTDREQLTALGISAEEIERQLRLFAAPPHATELDRPSTIGDGIVALDAAARRVALAACGQAVSEGRVLKFVPASGAATRMFQDLLAVRSQGAVERRTLEQRAGSDAAARETLIFFDSLDRFAFVDQLAAAIRAQGGDLDSLRRAGDVAAVLHAVLDPQGLGYASAPKGLILFHRYPTESRTAFEEHLVEGAELARGGTGIARVHFTVSAEHEPEFRATLERTRARYEARHGVRLEVGFSDQLRSTHTVAVDLENRPFRTADGRLLFRPGGHGALIGNLAALDGDIIYIKNIDNIPPDHLREPVTECARLLIGHVAAVQRQLFAHRAALEGAASSAAQVEAARRFVAETLHESVVDAGVGELRAVLDRPLRVCGMVRNTGEPGGGPFWVRGRDGRVTQQIVESAQVDTARPDQRAVFGAATHFNPVVMACGVRNWRGEPFDVHAFVDESAVFIAKKSKDGRALKALERPGLWNGAMARWNTIFVEVSDVTFTPVKTVNDLLRPAHQPAAAEPRAAATP